METTYPFIICEVKFDGNICKLLFVTNTYHNTYDKKAGYKKMFKDPKPLETNLSFFVKTLLTFGTYPILKTATDSTDQFLAIDHWKKNLPKLEKDLQFCEDFARKLEDTYGI